MWWNAPKTPFDPATDIPDLSGKVILVTGGNTGLGKQYILELCRHNPTKVWMGARNVDKAEAAKEEIRSQIPHAPIEVLQIDLTSFTSIKRAAQTFREKCGQLDILMLNAGVIMMPTGLTEEGYEVHFGTNYMGHALLTKLLLPTIQQTADVRGELADARILIVSSAGYISAPSGGIQFDTLKTTCESIWKFSRYGQSKMAVNLWVRQLADRYPNIKSVALHPGLVHSELGRPRQPQAGFHSEWLRTISMMLLGCVSCEEGVKNQLWATIAKDLQSGEYYVPVGVSGQLNAVGKDDCLAKKLWDWTEEELSGHEL